ncbi:MAG: ribulose-phosphate 3-epimerase, partial [Clostridia bacterium]|nr:ribulose-phosphate 3-epimerase [Clostridia bacterium]
QLDYIKKMQNFGADLYHLDVMDGLFVKNQTVDYTYLEQLKMSSVLLFDVHLMVQYPTKVIKKYAKAGANILTIHYEAFANDKLFIKTLKKIKKLGMMAGIAIDIDTKVETIEPFLKYCDLVLVMTVKAGKGGQSFNEDVLKKIKKIRKLYPNILIEVDGGINAETGVKCVKSGADILVSGSYIYNNDAYEAIQSLKGKK